MSMSAIDSLEIHNQAISLAMNANQYKKGSPEYIDAYREAFHKEHQAASFLLDKIDVEPTRSMLFKSAGCMAIEAELFNDAIKCAAIGIMGNPPTQYAEDLIILVKDAANELEARLTKASVAETALRALLSFVRAEEKNVVTLSQDFDLGITVAFPDGHYHVPCEPNATDDAVIAGLTALLANRKTEASSSPLVQEEQNENFLQF